VGTMWARGMLRSPLRAADRCHQLAAMCPAGITPLEICRFMGHAKVTTTLGVYTHLFNTDDHADPMAALDAMAARPIAANVIPLHA
jgi:hypothetical protein